jgi:ubiquinone/menaquinone biosynthesis C-methylase UbiE
MHDELLRTEFNQWAEAGRGSSMEEGHRPTGEQAIDLMEIGPDSRVLDLGCGNGWAARTMAARAVNGRVVGVDISDQMVELARAESAGFNNVEFQVGTGEQLSFADGEFTHAFSMESLYYYEDPLRAVIEVRRVLSPGGIFVAVVDLFRENEPSLQWVEKLPLSVHALSIAQYRKMWAAAGFGQIEDRRLLDPTPPVESYSGGWFNSHDDYLRYRENGSLMISGRAV